MSTPTPQQIYMNRMQREVCAIDAHTNVIVAGEAQAKACCTPG